MTPAMVKRWKVTSIQAILDQTEIDFGQVTIDTFFNKRDDKPNPRASASRRHTHEAPSPLKASSPVKKKLRYSPKTPEGVTPSKRDGKNAALLDACSPYCWI